MPRYEYKCKKCERIVELNIPEEQKDYAVGCWNPENRVGGGCDPQQPMYRL